MEGSSASEIGRRLARQAPRLRLFVAHIAGRALQRRVGVDDIVQDVFVRVLATPETIPPRETSEGDDAVDPALWRHLAHVARHAVIDVARALRAAKRGGARDVLAFASGARGGPRASQIVLDATGPATAVLKRETTRDLVASFERLSPEHRRVIGLRQFAGLSAAEAAGRMGRSELAVHSLYRRALAAWAKELGDDPVLG